MFLIAVFKCFNPLPIQVNKFDFSRQSELEILEDCSSGEIVLSLLLWLEIKSHLLLLAEGVADSVDPSDA